MLKYPSVLLRPDESRLRRIVRYYNIYVDKKRLGYSRVALQAKSKLLVANNLPRWAASFDAIKAYLGHQLSLDISLLLL